MSFQLSPVARSTHRGKGETTTHLHMLGDVETQLQPWYPGTWHSNKYRQNPSPSDHLTALLKTVGIKSNSLQWTPANISSIVSCHLTSYFLVTVMQICSSMLNYSLSSGHWYLPVMSSAQDSLPLCFAWLAPIHPENLRCHFLWGAFSDIPRSELITLGHAPIAPMHPYLPHNQHCLQLLV